MATVQYLWIGFTIYSNNSINLAIKASPRKCTAIILPVEQSMRKFEGTPRTPYCSLTSVLSRRTLTHDMSFSLMVFRHAFLSLSRDRAYISRPLL